LVGSPNIFIHSSNLRGSGHIALDVVGAKNDERTAKIMIADMGMLAQEMRGEEGLTPATLKRLEQIEVASGCYDRPTMQVEPSDATEASNA
jgi:hypothetical protein